MKLENEEAAGILRIAKLQNARIVNIERIARRMVMMNEPEILALQIA